MSVCVDPQRWREAYPRGPRGHSACNGERTDDGSCWCRDAGPWWAQRVPGWATPGGWRAGPGKDALVRGIQAVAANLEALGRGPLQGLVSQCEATKQFAMQAHALASQTAEAADTLRAELQAQTSLLVELLAPRASPGASVAPMPGLVPGTTLSSQGAAEQAGAQQLVLPGLFAPGGAAPDSAPRGAGAV